MRKKKTTSGSPQVFRWVPGQGPDSEALARMHQAFSRPASPMGEAWFMGSARRMYTEAIELPFEELDDDLVRTMLEAIASGTSCFGQLEEWRNWFHYLLPRALPSGRRQYAGAFDVELILTACFAQYPAGFEDEPYAGFGNDMLLSMGRIIMSAELWNGDQLKIGSGLIRKSRRYGQEWWYLHRVCKPLSALLFFCLKYLNPTQIKEWAESVTAIPCPYWRAQIIVWLIGAKPFLETRITQPNEFDKLEPEIEWEWSHFLAGNYSGDFSPSSPLVNSKGEKIGSTRPGPKPIPFVSEINLSAFVDAIGAEFPRQVREEWCSNVTAVPLLEKEMDQYARQFKDYVITSSRERSIVVP
jgi:hypothetical protein